ncbi:MAG TPA: pyruvate kinase [Actinomycetota bacterium]|nr:pyruvate kinase [Actinomycetota bacterium]
MTARTKLVCTLGPASATPKMVRGLVEAGATVFRINTSHGTPDEHRRGLEIVREVEEATGRPLSVLADLPGPKVRLREVDPDPFPFRPGQRFALRPGGRADAAGAATTHEGLAQDLRVGDRILLADGAVELTVVDEDADVVQTECVRGGAVRSHQGVNVPAERLSLPAVTDRDRAALSEVLTMGVDLVAQSFVRSPADVEELRAAMGSRLAPIVAKIETRPAVDDFAAILAVADAVMVARGDLGVELPIEEIPLLQKRLLREARGAGRPVIVATQMLESMIRAPRPTRAEANDVATAVLDGADAIMLSAETAVGDFPFEAASVATRIARAVESHGADDRAAVPTTTHTGEAAAVAHAAASIVEGDADVVAITCYTTTGRTAALLSAERPRVPIHAFIPDVRIRRANGLLWGVNTLPADRPPDTDTMIAMMDDGLRDEGLAKAGDVVVMAASMPAGRTTTNMLKVHQVGSMT